MKIDICLKLIFIGALLRRERRRAWEKQTSLSPNNRINLMQETKEMTKMKRSTILFSIMVMLLVSGLTALPARADSIWLEAECASVGSLWNKVSDSKGSNSFYATI